MAKPRAKRTAPELGMVLYDGPSMLDGSPIIAIATLSTSNRKTGDMVQVWIIPKPVDPLEALHTGQNFGACGTCPLAGSPTTRRSKRGKVTRKLVGRACYVNVGQAPGAIHRAYRAGRYPNYDRKIHEPLLRGRKIRLGAYGDPAALPDSILMYLVDISAGHTGYSHQLFWIDRERADKLATILMVSCHTPAQHNEAVRRGWRPFTAVVDHAQAPAGAIECPAYTRGIQCEQCMLCQGTSKQARPIYVIAHGKPGLNLAGIQAAEA